MIMFGHSTKELFRDSEKCLDPQLWHACAGGMVQLPPANSKVYYFPQGHAEHSVTDVEFPSDSTRIPAFVLCHVASVKFLADKETDEVFAKIRLVPVRANEPDYYDVDDELILNDDGSDAPEKPTSFAKTLTQSDANNGGGFSVPRFCAETIFPPLDYSADPPLQTLLAKDVHGEIWKFRHIYRGTPRRHLLTTGWSNFVNQKKLVAGDSVVFLRTESEALSIGIRRTKRGLGVGAYSISRWNPPPNGSNVSAYGGFSTSLREEESKLIKSNGNGGSNAGGFANVRRRGRVKAESVVEAATFAATQQTFEVVYYPRPSLPEFCVKAGSVRASMGLQWCSGMRCKMPFETDDSSRISWFMGTISSVQVADPLRWPNSPWRLLQVTWDEPDLLQNVRGVSPWLVELVSSIPSVHLTPFSPHRKKLRIPQHPECPLDIQFPTPVFFSGNHPFGPSSNSAGIQGTRHLLFGNISLPNLHVNKVQSRLLQANFHHLDHTNPTSTVSTDLFITNPNTQNDVSCLLTIGCPGESLKKPSDGKTPLFVLFGKPIHTEEQISLSNSGNSLSDGKHEKITSPTDGFLSSVHQPSCEGLPWFRDYKATELELETGHCKVFLESENVGRTLDLSVLSSYEELYDRLAAMFGVEKFEMSSVLYCNGFGKIKHTGDEPFSDFMKTTRRLRVLLDSASDNIGK